MKIKIYQIFYDAETKKRILPGFIPLDNSKNPRPDWFEFYPILNYLKNNDLEDNTWYAFLSPKFYEKTGFNSDFVVKVIEDNFNDANVALFSPSWDQLCYFLNPFEQGEVWHPGLLNAAQKFFTKYGLEVNLKTLVCHSRSSAFSNYIVAKKEYWIIWKNIAQAYFDYCEADKQSLVTTSYGSVLNQYPLKTFIQERFVSLILSTNSFQVLTIDMSFTHNIFKRIFLDDTNTRKLLQACDLMKALYCESYEEKYLNMYWSLRSKITYIPPRM